MTTTKTKDPLREKVLEFIQVLKQAPSFTAANNAQGICAFLLEDVNLQDLKNLADHREIDDKVPLDDIRNNHPQFKESVEKLGAATLAMGLSSLPGDEYGFVSSANRDKAIPLANSSLTNMVPFLIEAHIDNELNKAALAQLRSLAKNSRFKEIYAEVLATEAVQFSIEEESSVLFGKSNYRSNLLFVYEFFRTGDTPYLHGSVPNTGSEQQTFADIVKAWLKQIEAPTEGATFTDVFNKVLAAQTGAEAPETVVKDWSKFTQDLMQIVLPTDILYLPNLNLGSGLPYVMETVLNSVAPDVMQNMAVKNKILTSIPQQTLSFAQELWTDWEKEVAVIAQAVQRSIDVDVVGPIHKGQVWVGSVDIGGYQSHNVQDHEYGAALSAAQMKCKDCDVWNKRNDRIRPAEDHSWTDNMTNVLTGGGKQAGYRWWIEDLEKEPPSCFLAGTLVHTSNGPQPIESLGEHDRVLTQADTQEWGIVSDERVKMPIKAGRVWLCGINDEPAFFTPNHPFVDKFRHVRAVDPAAAHRENPWLEVGPLKVGHVLLRSTDGLNYEEVPIRTLTYTEVITDYVYGVHLREGLRAYHANGFLVRMNYPEITIKSLADALRQVPANEQLRMLGHLQELQPLLSRFGQGTVMNLLSTELQKSESELASMKTKQSPGAKAPSLYFQSRSFSLSANWNQIEQLGEGYILPAVDCLEGQVWINSEACACARVWKRGFTWTRPLTETLWEHGMCTFGDDHDMVVGDGFIWIDDDPYPHKPGPKAVYFQAQTIALRNYNEQPQSTEEFDLRFSGGAAAAEEVQFDYITSPETANDTDLDSGGVESGPNSELDNIHTVISDPTQYEERQKVVDKIDGPEPTKPSYIIQDVIETYDLTCNMDSVIDMPTGRTPVKVLQVQKVRKDIANGVQKFDFILPALDQLAEKLSKVTPNELGAQSFYSTFVTRTELNESCVEITILAPERLALAADDNISANAYGETAKSYQNLKYSQHDITETDLSIPFVPSKIVLTTNTLEGLIGGQWIEFDRDAVGDDGRWHLAQGLRVKPAAIPVSPVHPAAAGSSGTSTGGQQPHFLPSQPNLRSTQDLVTGFAVDSTALKTDTQNLLKTTMYYHMDEEDRKGILGVLNKPTVTALAAYGTDELPTALAGELDQNLRDWIKNTYAPAWIAQNVASLQPEQQKTFNIRVDQAWQRRLKYFWEGSGKRCLSQCKEYSELNTQLSVLTFRRKYPRILTYISDKIAITDESKNEKLKGLTGGKKWAHLLFESLMASDMVAQIARESTLAELTKLNTLELYCTMLNALWRDDTGDKEQGPLTQQLSNAVRASLMKQNLFKHRAIDDPKQLENGIRDYLLELFTLLLDEAAAIKAGIAKDFRETMVKSMSAYCNWNESYAKRTARQNAEAALDSASAMIKSAASYATSTTEAPETFRSGVRGVARVFNAVRRAVTGIPGDQVDPNPAAAQQIPPKIEPKPYTGWLCFGLGFVMTIIYVKKTWESWGQWIDDDKKLTSLDKTRLVAGALQAFGGLVFSTFKSIQIYKGWDPKNIHKVGELTHAATQNLEMTVISKSMHMHPDAVLENTDFATRARRNAVASRDLAVGTKKARNVQAALLPDSSKPKLWRQRVTDLRKSATAKVKGWGRAVRARCEFSVSESFMRGFSAGVSLVMLVLACITAGQLWAEQTLGERILSVLTLVTQFCNLIVEIAVIFCAIPGYIGVAILLVGMALQLIVGWIVGTPKAPTPRIQVWWENNKPEANGFFSKLPEEPQTTFLYSINQEKLVPGTDTTLIITASKRPQEPLTGYKRLKSVSLCYSAASGGTTTVLFDSQKQALVQTTSSAADPGPGETSILLPPSLQTVFTTESGTTKKIFPYSLTSIGTSLSTSTFDLGLEVDSSAVAPGAPLPALAIADGEQIVFKLRGVVALPGPVDEKDVTDYSKTTPPWKKFEIRIIERYADDKDEEEGSREAVLVIEKI